MFVNPFAPVLLAITITAHLELRNLALSNSSYTLLFQLLLLLLDDRKNFQFCKKGNRDRK